MDKIWRIKTQPNILVTFVIFKQTAKCKPSPDSLKFAQSGHPGANSTSSRSMVVNKRDTRLQKNKFCNMYLLRQSQLRM
jgi:hypothetical protein